MEAVLLHAQDLQQKVRNCTLSNFDQACLRLRYVRYDVRSRFACIVYKLAFVVDDWDCFSQQMFSMHIDWFMFSKGKQSDNLLAVEKGKA
eukprot:4622650-Amphidinium_carterae.1